MREASAVAARRRRHRLALALVVAASGLYVSRFVDRGWVPHDEGMIGVNAERVLAGKLPHRDFDESYTGGLTFLHAAEFRVFGARLTVPRLGLFALFLLFVAGVYAVAARGLPPAGASLVTLSAVAWSFPNYFASMPSWYVLVFAVLAVLALLRELDTGRRRWLAVAGACTGASLLVLVVGLYAVAAVLLYLAYREMEGAGLALPEGGARGGAGFFLFQAAAVTAFLAVLVLVVGPKVTPMAFLQLVLPPAAASGALLARAWAVRGRGAFGDRFRALAKLVAPFVAGLVLPVALFAAVYASQGALAELYRGVFVLPFRQIAAASAPFPPLASAAASVPYALLLALSLRRSKPSRVWPIGLAAALSGLLLFSKNDEVYRAIFHSARSLSVVGVVFGAALLALPGAFPAPRRKPEVFLLVAMAALLPLLQFPYAAPIYFCFAAPVVALALAAVVPPQALPVHAVVAAFYLAFALLRLNPGYIWNLGVRFELYAPLERLTEPRAGLRVPAADRATYSAVISEVQGRARGAFVYAAPDCPEIYFLTGLRNPTRDVFDYLRPPPEPAALLARLRETMVSVIVINERPEYSPPLDAATRAALALEFPGERATGEFRVRWRSAP